MSSNSPYAVAESEPPKWRPGEDLAASAFIGITIFLVLETNVEIFRVFKKRQGLYFWALEAGTWGCLINAIGTILKYLSAVKKIWPLYTLAMLASWSVYSLAELLVLYSRLHLIIQSARVQRWVFVLIISTIFLFLIPTWVVVWPAWDPDPKISSLWSPRDGIVERYTQLGFSLIECLISGIYIYSLIGLLRLKNSVRQRRVMLDLIYVNIIVVAFDILVVVLVYLNQLGLSHPVQTFSYILKLRLEFVVLNQLMAVAARGLKRETFADRRYHHSSTENAFSAELQDFKELEASSSEKGIETRQLPDKDDPSKGSTQISMPSPVLSKRHDPSGHRSRPELKQDEKDLPPPPLKHQSSDETIGRPESLTLKDEHPEPRPRRLKAAIRSARPHKHRNRDRSDERPISGHGRKRGTKRNEHPEDDDDEEEVGLHMWENSRGRVILEVPWFRASTHDV